MSFAFYHPEYKAQDLEDEIRYFDEDELIELLDAPLMAYLKKEEASTEQRPERHRQDDRDHRRRSNNHHHHRSRSRSRSRSRRENPISHSRIQPTTATTQDTPILTEAQRDRRTVFVRQLAQRTTSDDLREACESVLGVRVRDVRLVLDRISKRSKGVAYVEFCEEESVPKAVANLSGHQLNGIPMIVELTETEKNRLAEEAAEAARRAKREEMMAAAVSTAAGGHQEGGQASSRVFVGSLHPNIGEAQLELLFKPFGPIEGIRIGDSSNSPSAYAHIIFRYSKDAKSAVDQMNGFHLVDRPIKVALMRDDDFSANPNTVVDEDEVGLTPQARTELMLKLARENA